MGSKLPAYTAVVTTSFLAAVEGDCRRAIFPRHASLWHSILRRMLNAEHSAERYLHPALRQPGGIAARIRWIGERRIEIERSQAVREREGGLPVHSDELTRAQRGDVLFERPKAPQIHFDELRRGRATRQ